MAAVIIIDLDFSIKRDIILFYFHTYSRPETNMLSKSNITRDLMRNQRDVTSR